MIKIILLDCKNALRNYAFVIVDTKTNDCALIDTLDSDIIINYLHDNHLNLKYILNTHHHNDHTGGNLILKSIYKCQIYGNIHDKYRIKGITDFVQENDMIHLFNNQICFKVLPLDGHTIGHIGFFEAQKKWLFSGDTLFNLGCGRRFEGSAEHYYNTLKRIIALPYDTIIYGTHEYTIDNIRFAKHIIPKEYLFYDEFLEYCQTETEKRNNNQPTIPFTLESQIKFNPFLLVDTDIMQKTYAVNGQSSIDIFSNLRSLKDNF